MLLDGGNIGLAIKAYKAALAGAKKGHDEEYLALSYLGIAHDEAGHEKKAIECFQRSRELAGKIYGHRSSQYAVALSNEAMVHSNRQRIEIAEPLLDEAVAILRSGGKRESSEVDDFVRPNTVTVYSNAADCKAKLGKAAETVQLMEIAYKTAKSVLPAGNALRLQIALELGTLYAGIGRSKQAAALRDEVMQNLQRADAPAFQVLGVFAEAMVNSLTMLEEWDEEEVETGPRAGWQNAGPASNVVPLFAEAGARKASGKVHCAGYQLKVTLKRIKPPIWRRVVVGSDFSLYELHGFLQDAMGWTDNHLHEFRVGRVRFGDSRHGTGAKDERKIQLSDLGLQVGSKFEYEYDFGDGWEHTIEVEKLLNDDEYEKSGFFLAGKGACPPEDCGGPHGFMALLAALNSEGGRRNLPEWLQDYDRQALPEGFPQKGRSRTANKQLKIPVPTRN